jgi:hypothetical protein
MSQQFRPASSAVWGISGRIRQLFSGGLGQPKPTQPKRTAAIRETADTSREKLDRQLRHSRQQRHRTGLDEVALRHLVATSRHRLTDCVTPAERVALSCTTLHRRRFRLTHVTLVT